MAFAEVTGERVLAIEPDRMLATTRQAAAVEGSKSIAIIPIYGPVSARGGGFFRSLTSLAGVRNAVRAAAQNPDVSAIVLDIDSPGGTVAGTPETAQAVREARAVKKVVAVADTLAASAAYWIASQASEFVVVPSADVGSIGVVAMHVDMSKFLEMVGDKITLIHSSKYKVEGNPFEPLSPEGMAYVQSQVDESDAHFVRDVAEGRRVTQTRVREDFGEGRIVSAAKAVKLGMADRIGTMNEVLAQLTSARPRVRRSSIAFG
jgi:signal peptide peptidase SppA